MLDVIVFCCQAQRDKPNDDQTLKSLGNAKSHANAERAVTSWPQFLVVRT